MGILAKSILEMLTYSAIFAVFMLTLFWVTGKISDKKPKGK